MTVEISSPPEATQLSQEASEYFQSVFGSRRTNKICRALRSPGSVFFLRTNTLFTTNAELISQLEMEGVKAFLANQELNAVGIPITLAEPVPHYEKIVVADKPSSENVLLGSHLYRPGVIRTDRFHKDDHVMIINPRGHIVGSGIAADDSAKLQSQQQGLFVKVTHPFYALPSLTDLTAYKKGLFYSQSLSAMTVAPILSPQPKELIIDFCAAPGGKTTHIAQLTHNQCDVIAVDRSERRLARLELEAKRLGITCIKTFIGRANKFIDKHPEIQADRVLVDPPCTVLGVRPKLYDETTLARIRSTASYQRMILDSAITALRPGGILVYSTCTLTVEENEHNIQHLIDTENFTLEKQFPYIGTSGLVGSTHFKQRVQRIYPDTHDLPGYFIAKLRKPD